MDQNGFVYVSDWGNCRIQKFTSDGSLVTQWGEEGTGNGQFNKPSAITVDADNYVYVADSTDDLTRIQKFTSDGTFILKWDNNFPGGARWGTIGGLAVDENRNIYITDVSPKWNEEGVLVTCVHKIDPEGRLIITWERTRGFNEDDVYDPCGIALDDNEHIYLVDRYSHRIVKRNLNFEIINVWASYTTGDDAFMQPKGICVTDNGTIYVTDRFLNVIHIFSPEGSHTTWGNPGQFNDPINITVDHNKNIYVCDRRCVLLDGDFWDCDINYRIQKFTSDRQYITTISGGVEDDLWFRPVAIALDRSGNVYVADQTGEVVPCGIGSTVNCWEERHRIQKFKPSPEGTAYTPDIPWETWGNGNTFFYPSGISVGRDTAGTEYVYVADTWNDCIHKFTSTGNYITTWFEAAPNDTFNMPKGLASDDNGNVYVADSWNCRFLKFTSDGELITSMGSCGSGSGQMSNYHDLAVDSNEKVVVADTYNSRIQVFAKAESIENSRAIIVAGGGSYGNSLWDATQMCASFAYRALTNQGFTKDDITYLSEDTDLDLDDNRISDDGIVAPSNVSLRDAIRNAAVNNAENLVLYLTDHGGADESGDGTFNLGGSEILTAFGLTSMLDSFPGRVIVIIDACQSGSFMTALVGANRIIITSTQPDERAKFINQGTISFSNFFWTSIFNGSSIRESFDTASGAINALVSQTPQIMPPDAGSNVYIGNHIQGMVGDAPVIGNIITSPPQLHLETQAEIHANAVTDPNGDGIARVWAVIWPPHFDPGSVANPLTNLPSVDLLPIDEQGNYAGTYDGFISMDIYPIAVYAMDRKGNTSQPKFMNLSRNLTRRAVIVAGGAGGELSRAMIEKNTLLAYNALLDQFYDPKDIYFMMSGSGIDGVDGASSVKYLGLYLEDLSSNTQIDNLDLTIYLIGAGDTGTFVMNDDMNDDNKILTASQLYAWLNEIQEKKQARITLIYDGNKSGSFITAPETISPDTTNRIVITSTGPESAAYFKTEGSICFSSFFWDRIAAGATIGDAFIYAKGAISYCTRENDISFSCYWPQHPLIDANSNGIASEPDDYDIASALHLGDGVLYADYPPSVGSVSVVRDGSSLTITAHNVSSVNPVEKVWAVIRPISYCPGDSEGVPQQVLEQELFDPDEDGTYAYTLNVPYACKVTVYAMSRAAEGGPDISAPSEPIINQPGGDIYEDPDGDGIFDDDPSEANVIVVNHPSPQPHTFHHEDDADWVKFYGVAWENDVNEQVHTYTIEAGNLGGNCPVIQIYREDNLTVPLPIEVVHSVEVNGQNKVWFDFDCTKNGLYQEGS